MWQIKYCGYTYGVCHTKEFAELMNKGIGGVGRIEKAPPYVIPPLPIYHEKNLLEINEMANKKDMVTVTCYGREETLSRSAAIKKYKEGMMCCEGSERERYTNIYLQLIAGDINISDKS